MDGILDGKGQGPLESNRSPSPFTLTLPGLSFVEFSFAPSMIADISNTILKNENKIFPKLSHSPKLLFFFSQQLSFFKFKMVLVTFAPKIHKAAA